MIQTQDTPCWRIVINGEDHDMGEGTQHYGTEQAAKSDLDRHPGATAEPYPKPCVTVTCDGCENEFEGDLWTLHLEDDEQGRLVARESGWTVTDDGRMYCWDCPVPDADEDAA